MNTEVMCQCHVGTTALRISYMLVLVFVLHTTSGFFFFFIYIYIKILIYNITHETKKSQSPGTENLRCLGIQKKERKKEKKKLI